MKVLHLLSGGGIGGIEILCRDIAELSEDRHEFCFLYSGGEIAEEMKLNGMSVYMYFTEPLLVRIKKLLGLMWREHYDIVIVHHEGIGIYFFYLLLLYCFPETGFIKYLHCSFENEYFYTGNKVKDWIHYRILGKTLQKSDVCIAVSQFVKKSYCEEFNCDANRVKVVYNGIELSADGADKQVEIKNTVGLLYIGRLAEVKGVHLLLEAVRKLLDKGEAVTLEILGDGPMRRDYEELAEKLGISRYVHFAGNQLQKQTYYNKADIFVYPSVWQEAFGISIVEALAQGLVCIASNRGGIPEILEDGKDGFLFEGGNADALTDTLDRALVVCKDKKKRNMMKQYAQQKAAVFSVQSMINDLQEACKELIERQDGGYE